jgi:hypothetical protein
MRFFTRAWHRGDLSDEETELVRLAHQEHMAALVPTLPLSLRQLASATNLHDAQIHGITLDKEGARLRIDLIAGDLQRGYFDVAIEYHETEIGRLDTVALRQIATLPDRQVLFDEVDRLETGQYVHRMLFWPYEELEVTFGTLGLFTTPRPSHRPMGSAGVYLERSLRAV